MSGRLEESDLHEALRLLADLANTDPAAVNAVREVLKTRRVSGTDTASDREVLAAGQAARNIARTQSGQPREANDADSVEDLNAILTRLQVTPRMVTHDGLEPHLHWTDPTQTYSQQVEADLAMALAIAVTLGIATRLRHCDGEDCDRLIFDETKNRSTRYCPDRECSNRARQRRHRQRNLKPTIST